MTVEPGDRYIVRDFQPRARISEGRPHLAVIVGAKNTVKLWVFASRPRMSSDTGRVG